MIAGSIIIEQVFSIPGLGRILLTSISNRDYPVVMAVIVCIAVLVLVVNMAVDLIYGLIDPRITAEQGEGMKNVRKNYNLILGGAITAVMLLPVSYTHLDVYKRQV